MNFLDYASATYAHRTSDNHIITTLDFVSTRGSYNIFEVQSEEDYVVIFENQPKLINLIKQYPNALFAIKLIKEDDRIHRYRTKLSNDGDKVDVYTVGFIGVLANPDEGEVIGLSTLGATFKTV